LNAFADAGGQPNGNGAIRYYNAADQNSLDAALATIAGKALGCVYQLQMTPPDPTHIYVFFDKMDVPRDPLHMNGWDYDPVKNQVTFYGMACAELKAGMVKVLDIVFGCDVPPPN